MGDKKGVLSGRRYLVLCDKILWVELCEAGGRDSVTSKTDGDDEGRKQGEERGRVQCLPFLDNANKMLSFVGTAPERHSKPPCLPSTFWLRFAGMRGASRTDT